MRKKIIYILFFNLLTINILNCQTNNFHKYKSFKKAIKNPTKVNAISIDFNKKNCSIENLPQNFEKLINLSYLKLDGFRKLDLPKTFAILSQLPKLDTLILIDCGLERLGKEIKLLSHIEFLLFDKYKKSVIPPEIKNLKNLKHLEIVNSNLTSLPKEIENLKNLETLRICCNYPSISLPKELCNLPNLRTLDFTWSDIQSIPQKIGNLKNLEELSISGKSITNIPHSIGNLKKIKKITISNTQIKTLPIEFYALINLENINLSNNKLSNINPLIKNLNKLRYLNLSKNTEISSFTVDFSKMHSLKTLNLSNTKITTIPIKFIDIEHIEKIIICETIYKNKNQAIKDFGNKIKWDYDCSTLERVLVNFKELYGKVTTSLEKSQDTLFAKYSYYYDEPQVLDEEYKESYIIIITHTDSIKKEKIYTIPNSYITAKYSTSSFWGSKSSLPTGYIKFIDLSENYCKCFINLTTSKENNDSKKTLYKLLEFKATPIINKKTNKQTTP